MKFIVEKKIFEKLPNACFGVVMAKGIDNSKTYPEIEQLLDESIAAAAQRFEGKKVKEEPDILPYREAFCALDINPNKYLCSIEALFTRIAKGKGMSGKLLRVQRFQGHYNPNPNKDYSILLKPQKALL